MDLHIGKECIIETKVQSHKYIIYYQLCAHTFNIIRQIHLQLVLIE